MKYIAIDIGNVICETSFNNFYRKASRYLNIPEKEVEFFLLRLQPHHDLGLSDLRKELIYYFNIKSEVILEDLITEWNFTLNINQDMLKFITKLVQNENIKVALLSNMGVEHSKLLSKFFGMPVYNQMVKFLSFEIGARKPGLIYYKTFLDFYPEFKGCLYLDDRPENVEAANKLGFNGIVFDLEKIKNTNSLLDELAKVKLLLTI